MKLSHMCRRGRGFTLLELLCVIVIIVVVIAFLLPTMGRTRGPHQQMRCAANLKNIGLAMQIYSNNEKNYAFPRTYYSGLDADGKWTNDPLNCSNFGGPSASLTSPASNQFFAPTPHSAKSFDPGVVPNNCVTASIFLLMKSTDLTPDIFVCPQSNASRGFTVNNVKDWSNFEDAPSWGQYMTYSFACMFPGSTAEKSGFRWASTVANPSDFALAADMNPGNHGKGNQVTFPTHTSSSKDMAKGNSNNHQNQGQNVLYADGHVQWQTSPFCGPFVTITGATGGATGFNDNIYTSRGGMGGTAEQGTVANTAYPQDGLDCYLLPTDDYPGNGASAWGF